MLAVVLVTWMIFWMRRTARRLKGELTGKLESALGVGTLAVAGIAFVAVIREGLETALLFYAAAQGATSTATPLIAISLGVLTLGASSASALYAGAMRINLTRFFTVSGVLLVFVAAGILKYGIHDFQEAGVLPGLDYLRLRHLRRPGPEQLVRRRASPGCSTSPPRPACWRWSPTSPTSSRSWLAFLWPAARSVPASRPAAGASPNPENPSHVAA